MYSLTNATPPDPTLPTDSIPVYAIYYASSGGTELTQDLPSSGGTIAFYAPRFNQRGSKPVFGDWINYSSGFPTVDYTYNFIGTYPNYYEFSAFNYPAPNTAPIYKISDLSGKNIFYGYRLDRTANQKIHEVAFYAYPYSRRGPIGQEKWRRFEAAPQEWIALPGGNGYSVSLKSVFPGLIINGVTSASILVQTGPRGGKTPLSLPQTFDTRNFNFEYINGDIIVTTDGSQPDKVYEFNIDYL
ncbi:hypothetical protein [Pedobacter africanus]|uniref:Uncharacterized protein n=1 Tax=Pedobacter africanus TaxID=151894 RepID=A0A1W1ZXN4_9SPHI|nr:hypothetical protein [Pedobacter africanus]SMC53133.1 hypothetical protein SAMN04488524_1056 [Pedobacter africanus]